MCQVYCPPISQLDKLLKLEDKRNVQNILNPSELHRPGWNVDVVFTADETVRGAPASNSRPLILSDLSKLLLSQIRVWLLCVDICPDDLIFQGQMPPALKQLLKMSKVCEFNQTLSYTHTHQFFLPACEMVMDLIGEESALAACTCSDSVLNLLIGVVGAEGEWTVCQYKKRKHLHTWFIIRPEFRFCENSC